MASQLVEIHPPELKFTFELKKQCSCFLQLVNKSNEYVAFKVKTTSPKRYCVRPNTGVIVPHSTCDFTVTMQAQRTAPPDMQLKDKFLVQSTLVPFGTTDEDIVPTFFSKENGRHIEEHKLRVVLVSPPHSPVLQPISGALKPDPSCETPVSKDIPTSKDQYFSGIENIHPSHVANDEHVEVAKDSQHVRVAKDAEHVLVAKDVQVTKDVEDLKMKISRLELKLNEADEMITALREEKHFAIEERDKLQNGVVDKPNAALREEKNVAIQERDKLQQEVALAKVQLGFPFFFVVFVALVNLALGYILHK